MPPSADGSRASASAISSLREAMDLGLDGWVANTPDGSVRCVAEGPRDRLDVLARAAARRAAGARSSTASASAWMPATGTLGPFRSAAAAIVAIDAAGPSAGTVRTAGLFRRPPARAIVCDDGPEVCLRGTARAVSRRARPCRRARGRRASAPSPTASGPRRPASTRGPGTSAPGASWRRSSAQRRDREASAANGRGLRRRDRPALA